MRVHRQPALLPALLEERQKSATLFRRNALPGSASGLELEEAPTAVIVVVANASSADGANASERVQHQPDQRAVARRRKIRIAREVRQLLMRLSGVRVLDLWSLVGLTAAAGLLRRTPRATRESTEGSQGRKALLAGRGRPPVDEELAVGGDMYGHHLVERDVPVIAPTEKPSAAFQYARRVLVFEISASRNSSS